MGGVGIHQHDALLHPEHIDAAAQLLLYHISAFGVFYHHALTGAGLNLRQVTGQIGKIGFLQRISLSENSQRCAARHQTGGFGLTDQTHHRVGADAGGRSQEQQGLTAAGLFPEVGSGDLTAFGFVGCQIELAAGGLYRQRQVLQNGAGEHLPLIIAGLSQCQRIKMSHGCRSFLKRTEKRNPGAAKNRGLHP